MSSYESGDVQAQISITDMEDATPDKYGDKAYDFLVSLFEQKKDAIAVFYALSHPKVMQALETNDVYSIADSGPLEFVVPALRNEKQASVFDLLSFLVERWRHWAKGGPNLTPNMLAGNTLNLLYIVLENGVTTTKTGHDIFLKRLLLSAMHDILCNQGDQVDIDTISSGLELLRSLCLV